jgi:hypothetical protein
MKYTSRSQTSRNLSVVSLKLFSRPPTRISANTGNRLFKIIGHQILSQGTFARRFSISSSIASRQVFSRYWALHSRQRRVTEVQALTTANRPPQDLQVESMVGCM